MSNVAASSFPDTRSASSGTAPGHAPFVSWHLGVLAIVGFVALFARFLKRDIYWTFFEDDFFYYAQVAKNLALSHTSTFDGIHQTNGYHPLWLVVCTALFRFFPDYSFFLAVQLVSFVATFALYFAIDKCFTYMQVGPRVSRLAALTLTLHSLLLFRYGMEVTLALPLAFATLAYVLAPGFRWTAKQTLIYGLLASLTVLARLDMIFLFALLFVAQLSRDKAALGTWFKRCALYVAGSCLFFVYLISNEVYFRTLLPISGAAKQMKPLLPPSAVPIVHFIVHPDFAKAAFAYPAIAIGLLAAFLLVLRRTSGSPILTALLLFPLVHLVELCLLSDWHIWPWYYYSLTFCTFAGMITLLRAEKLTLKRQLPVPMMAMYGCCFFFALYMAVYAVLKRPPSFAILGRFVATYANNHPGVYAMGDCAGSAGFYSKSPVIQLEGLMMDKPYLQYIKQRTPLADVLQKYGVQYYATIQMPPKRTGCFNVVEPKQAGPASPVMRGKICAEPVAMDTYEGSSVGIFRSSDVLRP